MCLKRRTCQLPSTTLGYWHLIMRRWPSLALILAAVWSVLGRLLFALFPAQALSSFGLGTASEALIISRDAGVTLIGLGIINRLARNATGNPLRAPLWGNIFILVVDSAVNVWEIASGRTCASANS
jgi:hypothetical protein